MDNAKPQPPTPENMGIFTLDFYNAIVSSLYSTGGFTVMPDGTLNPQAGYAVAVAPERCVRMPLHWFDLDNLREFFKYGCLLDLSVGGWVTKNGGITFLTLDFVTVTKSLDHAMALGRTHDQEAIYDLAEQKDVPVVPEGAVVLRAVEGGTN